MLSQFISTNTPNISFILESIIYLVSFVENELNLLTKGVKFKVPSRFNLDAVFKLGVGLEVGKQNMPITSRTNLVTQASSTVRETLNSVHFNSREGFFNHKQILKVL